VGVAMEHAEVEREQEEDERKERQPDKYHGASVVVSPWLFGLDATGSKRSVMTTASTRVCGPLLPTDWLLYYPTKLQGLVLAGTVRQTGLWPGLTFTAPISPWRSNCTRNTGGILIRSIPRPARCSTSCPIRVRRQHRRQRPRRTP
jgi:hypothetical protein